MDIQEKIYTWQIVSAHLLKCPAYFKASYLREIVNNDGRCDLLLVDKTSGSVRMIRNDYSAATDKFAWTDMGIVFDGGGCPNHNGLGLFDLGVRFADVTGKKTTCIS